MSSKPYSIQTLLKIQSTLKDFLIFVKSYDSSKLPYCFRACNRIINNIEICKNDNWNDIELLSKYIYEDFESAMEIHSGLPEYYISNSNYNLQLEINQKIKNYIIEIDKLINQI